MNQTPELIFRKTNFVAAKHMKTFSFPENRIFSGNAFTRTKHSLKMKKGRTYERLSFTIFKFVGCTYVMLCLPLILLVGIILNVELLFDFT